MKGNTLVPAAIVISGLIIGGAVMLTNRSNVPSAPGAGSGAPTEAGDPSAIRPVDDNDYIKGSRDAKITIVEFSDTECPFCKVLHQNLDEVIKGYDDGDVAWVYRHFPLTQLHRKAAVEAHATECAGELGGNDGFWAYTDMLYDITPSNDGLDLAQLPVIAGKVGLDVDAFNACMDEGRHEDDVEQDFNDAVAAGGRGTPYSVIIAPNDQFIPISGALPVENWKETIDSLLN